MQSQARVALSRSSRLLSSLLHQHPRVLYSSQSSKSSAPSPIRRDLGSPASRPSSSRPFVPLHNPGVTLSQFRALFEPAPSHALPRRHRFRWDWHLRNFLIALIPPTVLYIFLKCVSWQFGGDEKIYGRVFATDEEVRKQEIEKKIQSEVEESVHKQMEERLRELEQQIASLREEREDAGKEVRSELPAQRDTSREVVARATKVAKTLRRTSTP